MDAWSHKTLKMFENFFVFFWKTTPYSKIFKILFRKFSLLQPIDMLCANSVKFGRRDTGEIARCLLDKTKFCLALQLPLLRGSRPKSAKASPRQRTQSALVYIQIGSLSAEL